jgi:hypothetical protein
VPKLWNETIEEHRRAVRDAVLETTAVLVTERGLRSVTMSKIAEESGTAWHEQQIAGHLHELAELRDGSGSAGERLGAVLEAYAFIQQRRHGHGPELGALLHQGDHVVGAEQHLHRFLRELLAEGVQVGDIRDDVSPDELATYCLHALAAAGVLPSKAAVRRLVTVTVTGLRPTPE